MIYPLLTLKYRYSTEEEKKHLHYLSHKMTVIWIIRFEINVLTNKTSLIQHSIACPEICQYSDFADEEFYISSYPRLYGRLTWSLGSWEKIK